MNGIVIGEHREQKVKEVFIKKEKFSRYIFKNHIYQRPDEKAIQDIIHLIMSPDIEYFSIFYKNLRKYTRSQIFNYIGEFLHNILNEEISESKNDQNKRKISFDINYSYIPRFSDAEDFCLYKFACRTSRKNFKDFVIKNRFTFFPCRNFDIINQRYKDISATNATKNALLDNVAKQIYNENVLYLSITNKKPFPTIKCKNVLRDDIVIDNDFDQEIKKLKVTANIASDKFFTNSDLALLISDDKMFRMRNQAVTIGRETEDNYVNFNLSYKGNGCIHISRFQAILSLLEDCNFYIENVGGACFRVNGEIIRPGKMCMLVGNELIDFFDNLYIFYPNTKLIEELRKTMSNASHL